MVTWGQSASTSWLGVILVFCKISCLPWREPFLTTPQIPEPAYSLPCVLYPISCICILYIHPISYRYMLYPIYTSFPISHIYVCVYIYSLYTPYPPTSLREGADTSHPTKQKLTGCILFALTAWRGVPWGKTSEQRGPGTLQKAMESQMLLLLL